MSRKRKRRCPGELHVYIAKAKIFLRYVVQT